VRVGTHDEATRIDATAVEELDLLEGHSEVDDHTVADDGYDAGREDAGRKQMQRVGLVVDDDGVPGVVAPL